MLILATKVVVGFLNEKRGDLFVYRRRCLPSTLPPPPPCRPFAQARCAARVPRALARAYRGAPCRMAFPAPFGAARRPAAHTLYPRLRGYAIPTSVLFNGRYVRVAGARARVCGVTARRARARAFAPFYDALPLFRLPRRGGLHPHLRRLLPFVVARRRVCVRTS